MLRQEGELKEILLENHAQPMQEQRKILNKTLNDWMAHINPENGKSYEQTDDVCMIGLRVH